MTAASGKASAADSRRARLAEALRANLKRRKEQRRERLETHRGKLDDTNTESR